MKHCFLGSFNVKSLVRQKHVTHVIIFFCLVETCLTKSYSFYFGMCQFYLAYWLWMLIDTHFHLLHQTFHAYYARAYFPVVILCHLRLLASYYFPFFWFSPPVIFMCFKIFIIALMVCYVSSIRGHALGEYIWALLWKFRWLQWRANQY